MQRDDFVLHGLLCFLRPAFPAEKFAFVQLRGHAREVCDPAVYGKLLRFRPFVLVATEKGQQKVKLVVDDVLKNESSRASSKLRPLRSVLSTCFRD